MKIGVKTWSDVFEGLVTSLLHLKQGNFNIIYKEKSHNLSAEGFRRVIECFVIFFADTLSQNSPDKII